MRRALVIVASLVLVAPLSAQSLLYRPPNLGGTWVPDPGVIQFNFLHRFYVFPGPPRVVVNYPTFTFGVGLLASLAVGVRYATNSDVPSERNEIELYGRWRRALGAFTVAVTPAYNTTAESVDGELGLDWSRGPVTLLGAVRGMGKAYGVDTARMALAGGAVLRLNQHVGLSGDVASLLSTRPGEKAAWSAGLVFVIPSSPHTFSLHVSNVDVNTIEGSSRKGTTGLNKPIYGFEFTIPIHPGRFAPWFRKGRPAAAGAAAAMPGVAEVRVSGFKFPDTLAVAKGAVVRWLNGDPVEHTITFVDASLQSSSPIPQGGAFHYRFDQPGTFAYHCTPHPFMKGTIVVQ